MQNLLANIRNAASALDKQQVEAFAAELIRHMRRGVEPVELASAVEVLETLRRHRYFTSLRQVADVMLQVGQDAPIIRQQYAQGLIEEGALSAAVGVLTEALRSPSVSHTERDEIDGVLARAHKQQYVEAHRPSTPHLRASLIEASRLYLASYARRPAINQWHGINAVACLARAKRDGITAPDAPDETVLAAEILQSLTPRLGSMESKIDSFDLATALEACVALRDVDGMTHFVIRYVEHRHTAAFNIASTLRQLTEVWELSGSDGPGRLVLPILRAALLSREHGFVELDPSEIATSPRPQLQRVFGTDRFQSLAWYQSGLDRARLVGRVGTDYVGGKGTGFLMRGEELHDAWRDRWVFLTNSHVVGDSTTETSDIFPDEARVTFEALAEPDTTPPRYRVRRMLWSSPPSLLDTVVLELDSHENGRIDGVEAVHCGEIAQHMPSAERGDRIYTIGHPAGAALSYSLQDTHFLDHREPLLHYRTPTEYGSSGSPLFDRNWRLVGLHHAGDTMMHRFNDRRTYQANEGISIHAVRQAIRATGTRGHDACP